MLAQHSSMSFVMTAVRNTEDEIFETKFKKLNSGFVTFWQGDAAYESQNLNAPGPRRRLVCGSTCWDYQTHN